MSDTRFSHVLQAAQFFSGYDRSWAVCGGWAIDLYLDRVTRPHEDVDFIILRTDQLVIQEYLSSRGWILEKAVSGQLIPWQTGEWINLPVHTIWCRNSQATPDFVELLFNEVDETNFLFRRDFSITLPLEKMIVTSRSGIPILAPEIILLYKSGNAGQPTNTADFYDLLPSLELQRLDWFRISLKKLYPDHVWLKDL
jgi:hypothetical protein